MKIALISPNPAHLAGLNDVLAPQGHQIVQVEGGKNRMRAVAEQVAPDLMLVDGMCSDASELALVEHISTHHPGIAVILLCPSQTPEFLINAMRAGVREVLPSPPSAAALAAALGRLQSRRQADRANANTQVLAFMGCKGGSGTTFLATHLGAHLAQSRSVLLVDLDLQFGNALSYVTDTRPASTLADIARDIGRLDAAFLAASTVKVSPGFSVLSAPLEPAQALEVKAEHVDAVLGRAQGQYDVVLLDLGRSLDPITIRALDRAHRILPVLQASVPHLRNAAKLMAVFKSLGYANERVLPLLNAYERQSEVSLADVQRIFGLDTVHTVPNAPKDAQAATNHGAPLPRQHAVVRALLELADSLGMAQEAEQGLLARLFRRA